MSINRTVYNVTPAQSPAERPANVLSRYHHIAINSDATITGGTLKIEAQAPGSSVFEAIPDADALDLTSVVSIQVIGVVELFKFTITGLTGATELILTNSFEVV